uniref:Diacylglycerol kinase n=1 Tax=Hymenolepis diminuta TaxID=6216 RepID=A0A158QEG8_HYMDI
LSHIFYSFCRLELFGRLPNVRILVCGGDGTVGWILSEIDSLALYPTPPIAILPLGTGNDLARTLQWGPGYADEPLSKVLISVEEGRVVLLDRWNITSRPLTPVDVDFDDETEISSSAGVQLSDKLPLNVMNNYFSLGADAATALEFHESREANPDRFNSRLKNKIFYAGVGGMDLIKRTWRDLSDYVTLVCDGVNMNNKLQELRPHVLLFLNIPKYSAGTVPWGHSSGTDQQQRIDDKKLEVIGLTTASLATLQMGGHGDRICQCSEMTLTTRKTIPMQIDGEPCRLGPSIIDIRLRNQAYVVQKTRRVDGNSPAHFGVTNTSGRLVKIYIIYPDPKEELQSFDLLMKTAQHFASLRIGAYSDLISVRRQIKHSHGIPNSNGESVKLPNKWIFLDMTAINGQVYGIDSCLEPAHFITDILSNDSELFLISQDGKHDSLPDTFRSNSSEDISRKSSESSQPMWENVTPMEKKEFCGYQPKRSMLCKSPSTVFLRNDVYKKVSFTVHLGTSISCPNLDPTSVENLTDIIQKPSRQEVDFEGTDDTDYYIPSTSSTFQQRKFFPDWRKWRRLPPKILVSMATCKRVKEGRIGIAPDPVQSLNSLLAVAEPSPPVKETAMAKISVTSDPGFSPSMHRVMRNNLRTYVRTALDAGISPLISDPTTGKTGLHHAAKFGRTNILHLLTQNAPKELLDMRDFEKKQTALHKAAAAKHRRACEVLVRAGACAICEDVNGDTPSALALAAGDKKLSNSLQKEELMQLIKRSNEGGISDCSAKLTSLSNLMTSSLPPTP